MLSYSFTIVDNDKFISSKNVFNLLFWGGLYAKSMHHFFLEIVNSTHGGIYFSNDDFVPQSTEQLRETCWFSAYHYQLVISMSFIPVLFILIFAETTPIFKEKSCRESWALKDISVNPKVW